MDGVGPVGGSFDSLSGTNFNTTPVGKVTVKDSLESIANGNQVFQSILTFMDLVGETSNELQETVNLSNQAKATSRIAYYRAVAESALGSAAVISQLIEYSRRAALIYDTNDANIDALNAGLVDYNTYVNDDQSAVNAMNFAIAQYMGGFMTEADYNLAVAQYNSYVAAQNARVAAANSAINTFNFNTTFNTNLSIDLLNATKPDGVPDLSHQSTYSNLSGLPAIPLAPPPPTSTISYTASTLTATSSLTPSEAALAASIKSEIYETKVAAFSAILLASTTRLRNASIFVFYQIFNLAGKAPNLPAAFVEYATKTNVSDASAPGGSGSSVPLAVSIGTLSSPTIAAVLSHSLFMTELQASMLRKVGPSSENLLLGVNLNATELISRMGLFSVNAAVRLLGGKNGIASIDPRSSIAATVLSVGLLNELTTVISAGIVKDGILSALREKNPGLTLGQLEKLASGAIASTELVLLLAGTLNLATALNSPKLVGQLLSTISSEGIISLLSSAAPFRNLIANPSAQKSLAASLENEAKISKDIAENIIQDSIDRGTVSSEILQLNITNSLIARGQNAEDAARAAANVVNDLRADIISEGLLSRTINKETIAATALNTVGVLALIDRNNGSLTLSELRRDLIKEFQQAGLSKLEARLAARELISSLDNTFESLSPSELRAQLNAQVQISALQDNIDALRAGAIANELADTLLGGAVGAEAKSVAELLSDRINIIKSFNDKIIDANLQQVFKDYTTPDLLKYGLTNILGDPAKALLYLASGLIYTPDQSPSKPGSVSGQRPGGIDIPV